MRRVTVVHEKNCDTHAQTTLLRTNTQEYKVDSQKQVAVTLMHILRILARNLHVTRDSLSYTTLQMRGIVALHSLVQEEEEAETAQCPEESASRADRLDIEIDGRFGSDSVLPNQLGVLRKLPVTSFKPTIPTDFEGSFLCT